VPEAGIYSGVFRKGFEQSHFYPADPATCGPWWMRIESEEDHARLETHARGEGRGRAVVVRVTVEGDLRGPVDFGFLAPFAQSLRVSRLVSAEPFSDEAFSAAVEASRACRDDDS
jgi:hypothetical protein